MEAAPLLAKKNRLKYLKAPTAQQIDEFVKELEVSDAQFERYIGLHPKCLWDVRNGIRDLPAKAWGYIYEKKLPTIGLHYQFIDERSASLSAIVKKVKQITNSEIILKLNSLK